MKWIILFGIISQILPVHASLEFCPDNSFCTPEQAKKYQQLDQAFSAKNHSKRAAYFKKWGFPILFLATTEQIEQHKYVSWNSRCENHKKNKLAYKLKAEKFLKKIPQNSELSFARAYLGDLVYLIPYEQTPIYIENNKLIFLYDVNHRYFELGIDPKGVISLHQSKNNKSYPAAESEACPSKNIKGSTKDFFFSICQKIWNKSSKRFDKIRFDWGCS